jgi:hypothetical protein
VLGVSLALFGCGGDDPPDRATSDAQIRRAVVDYNVLAAQGRGEASCEHLTKEKREKVSDALVPEEMRDQITDCASFWDWLGPRMSPAGRQVMLNTLVDLVTIDGERATATTTNGVVVNLRWEDGAWRIG